MKDWKIIDKVGGSDNIESNPDVDSKFYLKYM